jgi:hypothetical protein
MPLSFNFKTPKGKNVRANSIGKVTLINFANLLKQQEFCYRIEPDKPDKTWIYSGLYDKGFIDIPGVHARLFLSEAANKRPIK